MTRDEFAAEALKGLLLAEAAHPSPLQAPPLTLASVLAAKAFAIADEMVKESAKVAYPYGVVTTVPQAPPVCPVCGGTVGRWDHDPVGWLQCTKCSWKHHP